MYDKVYCLVKFGMMDSKDTAILDDQRVPSQSLTWKLKMMESPSSESPESPGCHFQVNNV